MCSVSILPSAVWITSTPGGRPSYRWPIDRPASAAVAATVAPTMATAKLHEDPSSDLDHPASGHSRLASQRQAARTLAAGGPAARLLLPQAMPDAATSRRAGDVAPWRPDDRFRRDGRVRWIRGYDLGAPPPRLPADAIGHQVQQLDVTEIQDFTMERAGPVFLHHRVVCRGVAAVLAWLARHPGDMWEERWLLCGADAAPRSWRAAVPGADHEIAIGANALIVARVLRPRMAGSSTARPASVCRAGC